MWESRSDFQGRWEGWKSWVGISTLSTGRHFHRLLWLPDPQPPPERDAQCAVKLVLEGVQKSHRHRSIENLEVALIQRSQPHPLMRENLAHKGTLALHLQAALLRNATHFHVVAVLQLRHPARHRPARCGVTTGRSLILERLMRTLVI